MNYRHANKKLKRMDEDPTYDGGYSESIARAFRKRMGFIRAAANETDFYAMKSLHYEKLKGKRSGERSMRLNDQFRLILRIEKDKQGNTVVVVDIEDYH
jgi:proteic killer suppression protein